MAGIIEPGKPRVMHRSYRLRSSQESAGPRGFARRSAARAAVRAVASAVSAGIFPSGGSMISQAWLPLTMLRSFCHQSSGAWSGPCKRFDGSVLSCLLDGPQFLARDVFKVASGKLSRLLKRRAVLTEVGEPPLHVGVTPRRSWCGVAPAGPGPALDLLRAAQPRLRLPGHMPKNRRLIETSYFEGFLRSSP